jgi:hypothetical protein
MSNYEPIEHRLLKIIQSILFCLIIISGGVLFFGGKWDKVSIEEKRKLTPLPSFSWQKLIKSEYTDSIDLFYSDNFIYRQQFIFMADKLKQWRGCKTNEIQYFSSTKNSNKQSISTRLSEKRLKVDSSNVDFKNNDIPYENFKSVIIANNRAIQQFGGSDYAAQKMAKLIKKYKYTFNGKVNVVCMAAPIGSDYYLPEKINHRKEKEFIDHFYSLLDSEIVCVRAYEEIAKHRNEYIYFNTDHHWTGLGAYYAYLAFCKSTGIAPIQINQMTRKVINNFLGTLYYYTRSEELKQNIDSVVYYKIPINTSCSYFKEGISKSYLCSLYAEYAKGGNAYGVFLGSDYPMMRIVSSNKNAKKLIVLKDSYGNAFSTYLPSHFEEVFVIDYRYFKGSITELVKKYGITDILFSHNVYVYNSDFTLSQELSFLEENTNKLETKKRNDIPKKVP